MIRYHVVLEEKLLKNDLHNGMHRETMLGFSYLLGFFLRNDQVQSFLSKPGMGVLAPVTHHHCHAGIISPGFLNLINQRQLSADHHKVMTKPDRRAPTPPPCHQPSDNQGGCTTHSV